jgi:hypothetical protein
VAARCFVFIADAGNNRAMAGRGWSEAHGARCDFVLGQTDVMRLHQNRGAYYPTAGAVNMPYGLCVQDDRLIFADTGSSRLRQPVLALWRRRLRLDASNRRFRQ